MSRRARNISFRWACTTIISICGIPNFQPHWNSVNAGPRRDIVGEWATAARARGLPFGVSEHLGASYSWLLSSHGADQSGALAGVAYDGRNPEFADLYGARDFVPTPADIKATLRRSNWYADRCRSGRATGSSGFAIWSISINPICFTAMAACLLTKPDANWWRISLIKGGSVYNHKTTGSGTIYPDLSVNDVERGSMSEIRERPWQCDTSIGDWYYSEDYPYKTTAQTIHLLADVVSKNGSLLLNIVQYPDGSLPPQAQQFLEEMAVWIKINGEAIYGTRPYLVFGEGPTVIEGGHFKEKFPFTARDIRFTRKDDAIYAITLGVPQEEVRIEALGTNAGEIARVELLGCDQKLNWTQRADALFIEMPAQAVQHSAAFKIIRT